MGSKVMKKYSKEFMTFNLELGKKIGMHSWRED
jgi:hypothetical protein